MFSKQGKYFSIDGALWETQTKTRLWQNDLAKNILYVTDEGEVGALPEYELLVFDLKGAICDVIPLGVNDSLAKVQCGERCLAFYSTAETTGCIYDISGRKVVQPTKKLKHVPIVADLVGSTLYYVYRRSDDHARKNLYLTSITPGEEEQDEGRQIADTRFTYKWLANISYRDLVLRMKEGVLLAVVNRDTKCFVVVQSLFPGTAADKSGVGPVREFCVGERGLITWIAIAGNTNGTSRLFDLESGEPIYEFPPTLECVFISGDYCWLVFGSGEQVEVVSVLEKTFLILDALVDVFWSALPPYVILHIYDCFYAEEVGCSVETAAKWHHGKKIERVLEGVWIKEEGESGR